MTTLTAETDSNKLLGRPNGYTDAAVLTDMAGACDGDPGVACGATIEIWPTNQGAQARADYIQGLLKDSPILGSEYDTVSGGVLLRVTGDLTPDQAGTYATALTSYIG